MHLATHTESDEFVCRSLTDTWKPRDGRDKAKPWLCCSWIGSMIVTTGWTAFGGRARPARR